MTRKIGVFSLEATYGCEKFDSYTCNDHMCCSEFRLYILADALL